MFVLSGMAFFVKPVEARCSGVSPNLTAPTWADVAACHRAAKNGDTITVAPGTYTVTTTTAITKFVTILGGGAVTLIDNTCVGSTNCNLLIQTSMLLITESTAGSTKFSGFVINQGTAVHSNPSGTIGIQSISNGQPIIISNNTYTASGGSGDFIIAHANRGVISQNTMNGLPGGNNCLNNNSFVRHKITSSNAQWQTPPTYGAADSNGASNLYVETNTIKNVLEAIDSDDNARTVVRYNTITNSATGTHGTDTSGTIGGRYVEIYNNTFIRDMTLLPTCAGGTLPVNMQGFIFLRGGTALIHDNTIPPVSDPYWGQKTPVGFLDENLRRNAGGFPCWSTVTAPGAGYPSPHQVGWGYSTGATNPGGVGTLQDLEPVYLWNNTGGGNYDSPAVIEYGPNECGTGADSVSNYVRQNREYYVSTPKPGYKPYTYPHPLTTSTQSSTSSAPTIK